MDEERILDNLKPICLCKAIRKGVLLKHIAAGLKSVEALQRATGAGSGSCQGRRCTPRILDLLKADLDRR